MVLLVTLGLAAVVVALLGLLVALRRARARSPHDAKHRAPGPKPWPLLGSLHLMGRYEVPFEAFTALAKVYGDIYSITLGTTTCVVVNNFQLIKEVLITKGSHFGGRPDFIRFHKLFGGDRNNSYKCRLFIIVKVHFISCDLIIRNIKSRRLRWAGHVARIGESRNAYRVLVGRPEGKRPLGRSRRRWEDNIKMDLREVGYDDRDWINLAQDRDQWRAYVRAAMNLRVP
ncbi:hypothetical protein ANN_00479 [Periplaneta americana]|uniref:Cytochrome P450 n=1 Tax=Periplaneta americana TaxID=6978 RepID=A0ABQ8TR44_PERAM|nr:hypothetical protein ANN_00479 [Periplaneta americana]